jgi:hypothetical protein
VSREAVAEPRHRRNLITVERVDLVASGHALLPLLLAALEESDQASDEEEHGYHHSFCRTGRR